MNTRWFVPLFAVAGIAGARADDDLARTDLTKLRDSSKREAEVQRLIGPDKFLTNYRFHEAPQREGKPLYVLLASYDYDFEREGPEDKPWFRGYRIEDPGELFGVEKPPEDTITGTTDPSIQRIHEHVLFVFDSNGEEIRPFGGNNFVESGFVADLNGDGILERADVTNYGFEDKLTASVLEIDTLERKPRPLLRVVLHYWIRGVHGDEQHEEWAFNCLDDDKDGMVEISFGPNQLGFPSEKRVVFPWNGEEDRFESGDLTGTPLQVFEEGEKLKELYRKRPIVARASPPKSPEPGQPGKKERQPADAAFEYTSLKGATDAAVLAFFRGKPARDDFGFETSDDEEASPTHLPEGFWSLAPRAAAVALVEANRTSVHRKNYQVALDDRGAIGPPKSGWILHDYHGDNSYTYYAHVVAIRFGAADPYLLFASETSQGMVGANHLVDHPSFTIRVVPLTVAEARFLADTVFWLDRIRTRARREVDSSGGSSSSADGWASLHLIADGAPPRQIDAGTIPAFGPLASRFTENYEPNTCLNMVDHLLGIELPKRLEKRWSQFPDPVDQALRAGRGQEKPEAAELQSMREVLQELSEDVFARHAQDPIPATALRRIIDCAGDEGLLPLREPLEKLAESLPPEDAEDREFARLRERFRRDHFGNWLNDRGLDEEHKKDYERYEKLIKERRLKPGPALRHRVAYALKQLNAADQPDLLMEWARGVEPGNTWALQRLEKHHPEAHADILRESFLEADGAGRRNIFNTLAAANPKAALRLRDRLSPEEVEVLILEVANLEAAHDPASLAIRVPVLFKLAENPPAEKSWHRDTAMRLLEKIDLGEADQKRFDELVVSQLVQVPAKEDDGLRYPRNSLNSALEIMVNREDNAHFWEPVVKSSTDVEHYSHFHGMVDALQQLPAPSEEARTAALEALFRHRFETSDGMMDDAFLTILALDLRGLKDDLQQLASPRASVRDGLGADFAGGGFSGPKDHRYHAAREVLALWAEPDQETRARMWIALVMARSWRFEETRPSRPAEDLLRERASREMRQLAPARRRAAVEGMLAALPPGTSLPVGVKQWLEAQ